MTQWPFSYTVLLLWLLIFRIEALIPSKIPSLFAKRCQPYLPRSSKHYAVVPVWHMTKNNASDDGPLCTTEIMAQLNARRIRYVPSATRRELEQLLMDTTKGNSVAPFLPFDLPTLVKDLTERGVRIPRYASRRDLETLWIEHSHRPQRRRQRKHKPIREILQELDELGVKYPLGASPRTLELLLQKHRPKISRAPIIETPVDELMNSDDSKENGTTEVITEMQPKETIVAASSTQHDQDQSLEEEMEAGYLADASEDDHRTEEFLYRERAMTNEKTTKQCAFELQGIEAASDEPFQSKDRIPPGTEIEGEISEANGRTSQYSASKSEESLGEDTDTNAFYQTKATCSTGRGAAQKKDIYATRRVDEKTNKHVLSNVSDKLEKAARKARYATRAARDFWAEDENGIRDVNFDYVKKDDNIVLDVTKEDEHLTSSRTSRKNRSQSTYRASRQKTNGRPSIGRVHSNTEGTHRPSNPIAGATATTQSVGNVAAESPLFRLPPAELPTEDEPKRSSRASGGKGSGKKSSSRRIYSPYINYNDVPTQMYRDSIDRISEFFVNTADTLLWGRLDDDDEEEYPAETEGADKSSTKSKKRKPNGRPGTSNRGMHWRDRLEERFDSMLGIHENGNFYNRWSEEQAREEAEAESSDAFSVAQGRAPKHRRKAKVHDTPFWGVGSMFSGLFGRLPPKGYRRVGPGNLLPLIKATAKSLAVLGTNACEWASVRGSIPQPLVVIGVTSCFLSARQGKRLVTLGIALVAFRIFGELIHEGLYGAEGWEGPAEEELDEDNEEDVADEAEDELKGEVK